MNPDQRKPWLPYWEYKKQQEKLAVDMSNQSLITSAFKQNKDSQANGNNQGVRKMTINASPEFQ